MQGRVSSPPDDFLPEAQVLKTLEVTVPRDPFIADFGHKFASFGSCFAQNMKAKLDVFGFETFFVSEVCAHYNMETLAGVIEAAASGQDATSDDLFVLDDKIFAYRHHFKFAFQGRAALDAALVRLSNLHAVLREAVSAADSIIITLGTSNITRLKANGGALVRVLGIPSEHWNLEMLDTEQNLHFLRRICAALAQIRGGRPVNLILTVSPQRYLFGVKPGLGNHEGTALVENFLSKANLRLAAQNLTDSPPPGFKVYYFPALEIVYEELRMFESLAHCDYGHISQQYTPDRVVKQFLVAHAADPILEQLSAITRVEALWGQTTRLLQGGWTASDPQVIEKIAEIERDLDHFGDDLAAPMLNYRFLLLQHFGRPLKKLLNEYRFRQPGNLVSDAHLLAGAGQVADAMRLLRWVVAYLGPRRTEDPDAGQTVEHTAYNEAHALLASLTAQFGHAA